MNLIKIFKRLLKSILLYFRIFFYIIITMSSIFRLFSMRSYYEKILLLQSET
jgi:hypothetical protein